VQAIDKAAYGTAEPAEWLEEGITDHEGYYFLVYDDETPVGYCGMYHMTSREPNYCKISTIAVLPEHHGKGLGRFMLQKTLDTAKELGLNSTKLEVATTNIAAINLYKSFDFIVGEHKENYYENGDDAYIMWYYSGFKIRSATVADAEGFGGVHVSSWQAAYKGIIPDDYLSAMSPEASAQRLVEVLTAEPDAPFFVAELNGKIIGNLLFGKFRNSDYDNIGEVGAIYLLPEYWGKGYGKAMMGYAMDSLHNQGYKTIIIWALEQNERARNFYEKMGFEYTGQKNTIEIGKPLTNVEYSLTRISTK